MKPRDRGARRRAARQGVSSASIPPVAHPPALFPPLAAPSRFRLAAPSEVVTGSAPVGRVRVVRHGPRSAAVALLLYAAWHGSASRRTLLCPTREARSRRGFSGTAVTGLRARAAPPRRDRKPFTTQLEILAPIAGVSDTSPHVVAALVS